MADNKAQIVIGAENRAEGVLRQVRAQLGGLAGDVNLTQRAFGGLGGALAGALTGAGLAAFFKNTADGLDRLNDVADVTGATIENISALEDVAARTGTSIDTIEGALVKLNLQLSAADGKNGVSVALKQIGLDAEQLKKVDPAEALRLTAVALGQFADDGDKARLVQELFGKSVREVGPLLKDLATQTKLVATVTSEQAREAEKFNQQLLALQKNSLDFARNISGPVISSLNDLFEKFKQFDGFSGFLKADLGLDDLGKLKSQNTALTAEVTRATDTVFRLDEALKRDSGNELLAGRLEKARARLEALRKEAAAASEKLKGVADSLAPPETPDALSRRLGRGEGGARSVGPTQSRTTTPRVARSRERDGGIEGLALDRAEAFRQSELATQALVNEALATARLSSAEAIRQTGLRAIAADQDRLNQLLGATPSAAFDQQQKDIQLLRKAYEETTISVEQYAQAVGVVQTEFTKLGEAGKATISDLDEFTLQASRNIQDQLGKSLFDVATGNFKGIGDEFGRLLTRMAAEATAAAIGKKLFGEVGKDGSGLSGGLLGSLGSLFSGFFADGGFIAPGRFGIVGERGPELAFGGRSGQTIQPMQSGGVTVVNNFTVPGQVTRQTQQQLASAASAGVARARSRKS